MADIYDPEGPEKYNNTEVKYGVIFYGCHTTYDVIKAAESMSGIIFK
jgi:hypothetical protein